MISTVMSVLLYSLAGVLVLASMAILAVTGGPAPGPIV